MATIVVNCQEGDLNCMAICGAIGDLIDGKVDYKALLEKYKD